MPTLPPFPLRAAIRKRLARTGQEFLAEVLQRATRRDPENLAALAELAHVLTRLGRLEDGLEADRKLVRLAPNSPTVHYNLACSLSLAGQVEASLEALELAIELGYDDVDHLVEDADLFGLHAEARFKELVSLLRTGDPGLA
jgi:Flp pilus assembly protein TadD